MMKQNGIKKMAIAALFSALVCVATMIVLATFPSGGYIHLGDTFVLLAGYMLGPLWGSAAAAVGSALTDLILGAPQYIAATFVVKGLVATVAYYVMRAVRGSRGRLGILGYIAGGIAGELVMTAGYFLYECFLYGIAGAAAAIPFNLIQGAAGIVLSSILITPLMKIRYIKNTLND